MTVRHLHTRPQLPHRCPSVLSPPSDFLPARAAHPLACADAVTPMQVIESSRKYRNLTTATAVQNCSNKQYLSINIIIVPPFLLGIYMYSDDQVSMHPTKISLLIQLPFRGRWGRRIKNKNHCNYMAQFIACLREQDKKLISYSPSPSSQYPPASPSSLGEGDQGGVKRIPIHNNGAFYDLPLPRDHGELLHQKTGSESIVGLKMHPMVDHKRSRIVSFFQCHCPRGFCL